MALVKAVDVSGYQSRDLSGIIAAEQPSHVIVKHYLPQETVSRDHSRAQMASAQANGCTVGGYVYCYSALDPARTVTDAILLAQSAGVVLPLLWLDIEPYQSEPPPGVDWIAAALAQCDALETPVGIYTGAWVWRGILGNPVDFADRPLWYAHYDGDASLDAWAWQGFGGWAAPSGKQYRGDPLDLNVMVEELTVPAGSPPPVDACGDLRERVAGLEIALRHVADVEAPKAALSKLKSQRKAALKEITRIREQFLGPAA